MLHNLSQETSSDLLLSPKVSRYMSSPLCPVGAFGKMPFTGSGSNSLVAVGEVKPLVLSLPVDKQLSFRLVVCSTPHPCKSRLAVVVHAPGGL